MRGLEVALLWLSLVVGMTLHFTYDVSGIRYGVAFEAPDATGVVPWSSFVLKGLFYVLPFLMAVGALGGPGRAYRRVNLVVAVLFLLPNAAHVAGTASAADDVLGYAQILLLGALLLANLQLVRLARQWLSMGTPDTSAADAAPRTTGREELPAAS